MLIDFQYTHIAMMYPKPLTEEAFLSAISDDIYMVTMISSFYA